MSFPDSGDRLQVAPITAVDLRLSDEARVAVAHRSKARFSRGNEKYYTFCRQFIAVSNSDRIFKIS